MTLILVATKYLCTMMNEVYCLLLSVASVNLKEFENAPMCYIGQYYSAQKCISEKPLVPSIDSFSIGCYPGSSATWHILALEGT